MWKLVTFLPLLATCIVSGYVVEPINDKEPFSFDDIFDTDLRPKGFSPRWVSGKDSFYYRDRFSGSVFLYNAQDNTSSVLINSASFTQMASGTYYLNKDLTHILWAQQVEALWRHSYNAVYKIQDRTTLNISDFPGPGAPNALHGAKLQYAGWDPTGTLLSFVHDNNLYYSNFTSNTYHKITLDGETTDIFNGIPDWLYEEDVIAERASHYWSPDGSYILYARISDLGIPFISWPVYGNKSNVYGFTSQVRYPKAGDVGQSGTQGPTSKVTLHVYDVRNNATKEILAPTAFRTIEHYYLQVEWVNNNRVLVTWANRVQDHMISVIYDVTQNSIQLDPQMTCLDFTQRNGWLEVPPPVPWFINDYQYITIHPHNVSAGSNPWRHLALVTCQNQTTVGTPSPLTTGKEEIDNIYGYSDASRFVYYSSTNGDSTERHIKRLDMRNNNNVSCLTCNNPASCKYITSSFSDSTNYYFENCRGPEIPTYTLKRTSDSSEIRVFESNADVLEKLSRKALPTREFRQIYINGTLEQMELFIPPDHTPGKKYPLLIYTYAGPGSQRVMKTFPIGGSTTNWLTYLKSTHKIAIASLDSRGASGSGDDFKFSMFKKLGDVEIQDQIAFGRYFDNPSDPALNIVNTAKSKAIFGWSYGGYTSAHVIGDTTKDIKCGISVAPVTTNLYYDTAYTERYLGLASIPADFEAYNRTDVMNKVQNFKDKAFLIAHGIADDNVHFMHATQLIQALAAAGVSFRQNSYVDQDHGIASPLQSRHLYQTLTEFLLNDCWGTTIPYKGNDDDVDIDSLSTIMASTDVAGSAGINLPWGSFLVALLLMIHFTMQKISV